MNVKKDYAKLLYDRLPKVYHVEDSKASYPLKRFLQVASVGISKVQDEIEGSQLLFDIDNTPEKYLDALGRMLGFNFPPLLNSLEKRAIIKNLPELYKLKGNGEVFEMLAKIIFTPDKTITSTEWIYTANTTTIKVTLLIGEGIRDIEEKMDRYLELIEFFRPVNTGVAWQLEVYYVEELENADFTDTTQVEILRIDDNMFGGHEYTKGMEGKPRLLNIMRLNETAEFYGILWDYYLTENVGEESLDILTQVDSETYMGISNISERTFHTGDELVGEALLSFFKEDYVNDAFDILELVTFDDEELQAEFDVTYYEVIHMNDNLDADFAVEALNNETLGDLILGYGKPEVYEFTLAEVTNFTDFIHLNDSEEYSAHILAEYFDVIVFPTEVDDFDVTTVDEVEGIDVISINDSVVDTPLQNSTLTSGEGLNEFVLGAYSPEEFTNAFEDEQNDSVVTIDEDYQSQSGLLGDFLLNGESILGNVLRTDDDLYDSLSEVTSSEELDILQFVTDESSSSLIDCRNSLNLGLLGSTMIISNIPTETVFSY